MLAGRKSLPYRIRQDPKGQGVRKMTASTSPGMSKGRSAQHNFFWFQSVKILLTNHQLINDNGTEVFVYTLADQLVQLGHEVVVYSPFLGGIREKFDRRGIPVCDDLTALPDDFHLAHVHHNITAYEVRDRFPSLPILYMAHGIKSTLEHLPQANIGISQFVASSDGIRESMLANGVPADRLEIVRNLVDERLFFPGEALPPQPRRALMLSNKVDPRTELIIREACRQRDIQITFVGARFGRVPNDQIPDMIRASDIVFSLGRGVIEAMFCGRVPIVFDHEGGDGLVTPQNFAEVLKRNFSGKRYQRNITVQELVDEIGLYHQEYGMQLRALATAEFSATRQTEKLLRLYETCLKREVPALTDSETRLIHSICEMIAKTRVYALRKGEGLAHERLAVEVGGKKMYRLFHSIGTLRYRLFPEGSTRVRFLQRFTRRN